MSTSAEPRVSDPFGWLWFFHAVQLGIGMLFCVLMGTSGIIIAAAVLSLLAILITAEHEYKRNIVRGVNWVGFVLLILWLLIAPNFSRAGPTAFRYMCNMNSMRQISHALREYHTAYGSYPPATIRDKDGTPLHSWRVLILPFLHLDNGERFQTYDFSEPWNGPHNRLLADAMPHVYRCEAEREYSPKVSVTTNYVAVVGPQTAWPLDAVIHDRDIIDGTSSTLQVVETRNAGIHWMEPRDLTMEQALAGLTSDAGLSISSHHRMVSGLLHDQQGANVAFVDGSVKFLPTNLAPELLKGLLTINGGESISVDQIRFPEKLDHARVATLASSLTLLTLYLSWLWFHLKRACIASSLTTAAPA